MTQTRSHRLIIISICTVLLLAAMPLGLKATANACAAPGPQRTMQVEVKALTKVVKRRNIAKIEVRTYRPAQENVLDSGVDLPPGVVPMQPAGDVRITVGVLTGGGFVYQNVPGSTNSEGVAVVKVRLQSSHKPGSAEVRARAFLDYFDQNPGGACVELQEYGYTEQKNAFLVR